MEIGEIIKKYRILNKLTQKEFGEILGVNNRTISDIEKNNRISPKLAIEFLVNFKVDSADKKIIEQKSNVYVEKVKEKREPKKIKIETDVFTEKEILDTYNFIRKQNRPLSKVADINRKLIDMSVFVESAIIMIEKDLDFGDEDLKYKVKRAIRTTIKRLRKNIIDLENIAETDENILYIKENG